MSVTTWRSSLTITPTGRRLLRTSFITSLKTSLCTALTIQNATENRCIISHEQNPTAFQAKLFLIGILRLLVTSKRRPAFSSAKHYQGRLKAPQLVTVLISQRIWFLVCLFVCLFLALNVFPAIVPLTDSIKDCVAVARVCYVFSVWMFFF
jgi:hypothetical protein